MKLSTIVFRRIAAVVLLALTIQVAVTLAECLLDEDYYAKHYIEIEASRSLRPRG